MSTLALSLLLVLPWALLTSPEISLAEGGNLSTETVRITSIPAGAAIFRRSKGRSVFIGHAPIETGFPFRSEKSAVTLLAIKPGYQPSKVVVSGADRSRMVRLTRSDLLETSMKGMPATARRVQREANVALSRLMWGDGKRIPGKQALLGKMRVAPHVGNYAIRLESLLIDDQLTRSVKKISRLRNKGRRQRQLATLILKDSLPMLKQFAAGLRTVQSLDRIDITVSFPTKSSKLHHDRHTTTSERSWSWEQTTYDGRVYRGIATVAGNVGVVSTEIISSQEWGSILYTIPINALRKETVSVDLLLDASSIYIPDRKSGKFQRAAW